MRRAPAKSTVALLLVLAAAPAFGARITVGEYRARLAGIAAQLEGGDWVGAGLAARRLLGDRVAFGPSDDIEETATDASVLGPIAAARDRRGAGASARRVARLADALATRASATAPVADAGARARLERLRALEALAELPAGGALPRAKPPEGWADVIAEFFAPLRRTLDALGEKLLEWLEKLFSRRAAAGGESPVGTIAIGVTVAIALGLAGLAILLLRRRARAAAAAAGTPEPAPSPAADEDPLSREVGEWRRYARELEAAGRLREAVRAWYHAVLVALYRTGRVHYRKGRTNWEYVASLQPAEPVRPGFAELTRRFEREWYGRDRSSEDALAAAAALAGEILDLSAGRARLEEA